jgi:SAM-dependent methyltransferase
MTSRVKRWLRPWLGPWRELAAFRRRRAPMRVDAPLPGGGLDAVVLDGNGLLAAAGWCTDLSAFERALRLRVNGEVRPPSHVFRVPRPEVEGVDGSTHGFLGAVAEWVLDPCASTRSVAVLVEGREAATLAVPPTPTTPYGHLHLHQRVEGRDGIYRFGPPNSVVSDEVLYLARRLPPPILDFGCGAGALVRALRREGIEAYGLEIDDARIRQHLLADVTPYVTLYDGTLPAPFADRRFASVACSEVLEHIPGPQAALAEMVRLATRAVFITVPDMSAIPRGFSHGVVPWHLLESTHVNFFTQHSLQALLAPHASRIDMSRLGLVQCDRMQFYSSLAAVARLDHA